MYLVVSPNQLGYFKPETTARRLKVFLQETKDERRFLTYLHFIDICSELFVKVEPLRLELYQAEVRAIYQNKKWESFMVGYLYYFREAFCGINWLHMLQKLRQFQRLYLIGQIGENFTQHLTIRLCAFKKVNFYTELTQKIYDSS